MANHCRVFTPSDFANELLDAAGYRENLYGRRVLENSCGDGNILIQIVKRYIQDCLRQQFDLGFIRRGLERDIIGYELEKEHYHNCLRNLDIIAADFKIKNVRWNLHQKNSLRENKGNYSYILGNPPYVTYKDIKQEEQQYIREHFTTCKKGKFDYYYSFVEDGINSLEPEGILAYIIPSSIYKNVFAEELRKYILNHVTAIHDYTTAKKFNEALTSSTILIIKKESNCTTLKYHDVLQGESYCISKEQLGAKWIFQKTSYQIKGRRFGDYFRVSNCVATLYNEAFVLTDYEENSNGYVVDGQLIEPQLIRNAISMKSSRLERKDKIIFPYLVADGKVVRISEKELKKNYPGTYKHLLKRIERLKKREADKSAAWFEYGRSQAIIHMQEPKLMMSAIITQEVRCEILDADTIPYAGFYVQPTGTMTLEQAKAILQSKEFYNYISKRSINSTGKSKRISVKEIQNYTF